LKPATSILDQTSIKPDSGLPILMISQNNHHWWWFTSIYSHFQALSMARGLPLVPQQYLPWDRENRGAGNPMESATGDLSRLKKASWGLEWNGNCIIS